MNCASNIITANFSGGKTHATTARVYQWSRGIELCITGADNLPQTFKAHFSVQKRGGVATTIVGIDERVDVPNVLFTIGKDIHVWLGASETEDDAEILYTVDIPVAPAPMPEYYDAEDTGAFDAVVEQVADYAATATAAANSAGASATAAAGSASAAAASASGAAGSAAAAEQARADAVTAKGQAENAAQTATEKAQQTAQNAAQAALDAGRAESAAERAESAETGAGAAKTAAEAAAQSAAASAATADEKATLAGQSATAAARSASAAAQSAASIEGDVQIASQKAFEAQTAAGQAVTAKDAAVTAQQGAETAATNAGQSAFTATTKAAEAATSASNAAQSKTDAEAAATRAEQAAASLTVDSALSSSSENPVQNKVIDAEITNVKSALSQVERGEKINLSDLGQWSVGSIDPSNGANTSSTTRIRTNHIEVSAYTSLTAEITSGYKWRAFFYNSGKTYLGNVAWSTVGGALTLPTGTSFIRLLMADTSDSTASVGMSANLDINASYKLIDEIAEYGNDFEHIRNQIDRNGELLYDLKFKSLLCTLVNGTLVNPLNANYISTAEYIPVTNGQTIKCTVKTGAVPSGGHLGYGYTIYDSNKNVVNGVGVSSSQTVDNVTLIYPNAAYIRWTVGVYDSTSTAVPQRANTFDGSVFVDVYGTVIGRNQDVLSNAIASCHSGVDYTYNGTHYSKKLLSMLFITDLDESEYAINNAVIYLNGVDFVDIGICMGDMGDYVASNGTWYTNRVNLAAKPFYTILGNRDVGNSASLSYGATIRQAFDKWIAPTRTVMGMPSLAVPYYSVKNDDYKLVLIFLNNYDSDDSTDGSAYIVNRGFEVFRSTQIDWLLSTLDAVPEGYTVSIIMHSFPYANTGIESNFTQLGQNFVGNGDACYTDIIPDIVNAWKNGTALNKTYAPHSEGVTASLTVDHDFTSRGNGLFACYFVGHSHRDVVAKCDTYNDQIVIGFAASATNNYYNRNADLPRIMGEKSEDVITLASIDTTHQLVNLCRIGSNKSFTMQDRTMTAVPYGG